MIMDYCSEGYPFVVDSVSYHEGTVYITAQTRTLDTLSVHLFKSDHPDYGMIGKLKPGHKIHYVQLPGEWSLDAEGEQYRVKRGWPRDYKEPKSLTKLWVSVAKEVRNHKNWCSADCNKFLPNLYAGNRILHRRSRRSVQMDYPSCHKAD